MSAAFIASAVWLWMETAAAVLAAVVIQPVLAVYRRAVSAVCVVMPTLWARVVADFVVVHTQIRYLPLRMLLRILHAISSAVPSVVSSGAYCQMSRLISSLRSLY